MKLHLYTYCRNSQNSSYNISFLSSALVGTLWMMKLFLDNNCKNSPNNSYSNFFLACFIFEKHLSKQGGRNVKNIGGTSLCGGCNLLPPILEFGRSQLTLWKPYDNIWSGPVPTSLYVPAGLLSTCTSIYSTMNFLRQNW